MSVDKLRCLSVVISQVLHCGAARSTCCDPGPTCRKWRGQTVNSHHVHMRRTGLLSRQMCTGLRSGGGHGDEPHGREAPGSCCGCTCPGALQCKAKPKRQSAFRGEDGSCRVIKMFRQQPSVTGTDELLHERQFLIASLCQAPAVQTGHALVLGRAAVAGSESVISGSRLHAADTERHRSTFSERSFEVNLLLALVDREASEHPVILVVGTQAQGWRGLGWAGSRQRV